MADVWTDEENDKCVAVYLEMLRLELAGQPYVKVEYNRRLQGEIPRSHKSIEFKHQNISAVLRGLGEAWIPGYAPATHFQLSLVDAVNRKLQREGWLTRSYDNVVADGLADNAALWIEAPPGGASAGLTEKQYEAVQSVARKFDVAGRDERNRNLGHAGEERVYHHEISFLKGIGRDDLARKVRWVSQEDGDGAGYDIRSFDAEGRQRLLEVKTTNGWQKTPFFISRNEVNFANDNRAEWRLFRLWDFSREPRAFELAPPLDEHVRLTANSFRADFG